MSAHVEVSGSRFRGAPEGRSRNGRRPSGSAGACPHRLRPLLTPQAWAQDFSLVRAYSHTRAADDNTVAGLLLTRFNFLRRPGLHVVHVASEMVPVAKVGGLGDVVTGLAKAHQQRWGAVCVCVCACVCVCVCVCVSCAPGPR